MCKKLQKLSFFAAKGFVISLLGFAIKASANIDSGGGVSLVGNTINHSSVGSPFATGAKTAGLIDMLYPITPESKPAVSKPAGSGGGGGGNAGGAGGVPAGAGGPSEMPSSKKNKGSGGGGSKKKEAKSSATKASKTSAAKNKEKKSGSQNSVKTKKKTK